MIDFRDPAEVRSWSAIDDVVMGGVSSSALVASAEGSALFTGTLSLEHGGGFASVRSPEALRALGGQRGLQLRVRGDGRRYQLRVRTIRGFDGITYQHAFDTRAGEWIELQLAFADFVPVFRGRVVADAPALDPGAILTLGLMIADRQAGSFRLELESLRAW
ncbi:MAG: CIA30 family protein [Planctomycetes bacterium]|nr:CIA30 family protein [Planctomycetota bacterium]